MSIISSIVSITCHNIATNRNRMNTNTNSHRYRYHPYASNALGYGARNQPQRNPGQIPKSILAAYTQQSGGEGSIARSVINIIRDLAALPIPNEQQNSFERTIVDTARHVMAEVDGTSMSTPVSESTDTYTNRGSLSSSSQSLPSIAQTDAPNGDTSASGSERCSATVMVKFNLHSLLTDRVDMDVFYDITRQHQGDSLLRNIERLNGVTTTSHLIQDHFITQHLPTYHYQESKRKRRSHDINGVEDLLSTRISLEHRISNLLYIEFKFISVTHLASFLIACGGKPRYHRTNEDEEEEDTTVRESVSMATKLHGELDLDEATHSAYVMVTNVLHRLYPGQWVGYQPEHLQDDNKKGPSRF